MKFLVSPLGGKVRFLICTLVLKQLEKELSVLGNISDVGSETGLASQAMTNDQALWLWLKGHNILFTIFVAILAPNKIKSFSLCFLSEDLRLHTELETLTRDTLSDLREFFSYCVYMMHI